MAEEDKVSPAKNPVTRIFGAGYWRKGKKIYEEKNKIHR
jgi:hypothetical protein